MNKYIVTGNGFLKSIYFDVEIKKQYCEFTDTLRDAKPFVKTKTALNIIKKFNIVGFVWNPYKEVPIKNKWEIVKRSEYNEWDNHFNITTHNVLEWMVKPVTMESDSDLKYLMTKGTYDKVFYDSYDKAVEICKSKNLMLVEELLNKINKS